MLTEREGVVSKRLRESIIGGFYAIGARSGQRGMGNEQEALDDKMRWGYTFLYG